MERTDERLTTQVVSREPVALSGASGNPVEHVTLRDGRRLVWKRVSPAHDWISRATGDDGRALWMWREGLFDRIPASIDHTTVAVEPDDDGWAVFMRDASSSLIPPGHTLKAAELRRVLTALTDLHRAFKGEQFPQLCSLTDRYNLISPATARNEAGTDVGDGIARCWNLFGELAPREIATAVVGLAENPRPLAEQLAQCEQTLIHGDVRLANLGLAKDDDTVILVDWAERTGTAPAAVELASFLIFDAHRFEVSRDDAVAMFRELAGPDHDERAMQLALIGGLVQLGPNLVLDVAMGGGDEALAAAKEALEWWSAKAAHAFETAWAPD